MDRDEVNYGARLSPPICRGGLISCQVDGILNLAEAFLSHDGEEPEITVNYPVQFRCVALVLRQ